MSKTKKITKNEQKKKLAKVIKKGLENLQAEKKEKGLPFPNGKVKYRIILADPPSEYFVHSKDNKGTRNAAHHYETMKLEELKALPVASIAAEDCALFMWASGPTCKQLIEVMEAWGFTYKSFAFVWVKTYNSGKTWVGMGHKTRASTEVVLYGEKGRMKRQSRAIRQLIEGGPEPFKAPVTRHSEKPFIHSKITRLLGDLSPKIELFARRRIFGWQAWGNEAPEKTVITESLLAYV